MDRYLSRLLVMSLSIISKRAACAYARVHTYVRLCTYIILNCTYGNHGTSEAPCITNCDPHSNSPHMSRFALAQKILVPQIIWIYVAPWVSSFAHLFELRKYNLQAFATLKFWKRQTFQKLLGFDSPLRSALN